MQKYMEQLQTRCEDCGNELIEGQYTTLKLGDLNPSLCTECYEKYLQHVTKCDSCGKEIAFKEYLSNGNDVFGMCNECGKASV